MSRDYTVDSCRDFVAELASSSPAPGGGGAAALVGAVGAALGNMVASLTVGKKKYADVEAEFVALQSRCDALQSALLDQVTADAEGFEPLARAYGIPKDDPNRAGALESATLTACEAPLRIMALCGEAIELIDFCARRGSRLAVSDAGCGAAICRAALLSASLNVFINTKSLRDRSAAVKIDARAQALIDRYAPMADAIFDAVREALC